MGILLKRVFSKSLRYRNRGDLYTIKAITFLASSLRDTAGYMIHKQVIHRIATMFKTGFDLLNQVK
jgi:hypothetical protein